MIPTWIMPMPIFMNSSGSGAASENVIISIFVTFNVFIILIVLLRAIIWLYKAKIKKERFFKSSLYEYIIWDDECGGGWFTALSFLTVNGLGIFILILIKINHLIDAINPSGI